MRSLALLSVLLAMACAGDRPEYDGRPVEHWVERLASASETDQNVARIAILSIGRPAVPVLVDSLSGAEAPFRQRLVATVADLEEQAAEAMPVIVDLARHDGDFEVRAAALTAIGRLASAADLETVRSELALGLESDLAAVRLGALRGVAALGTESVPLLGNLADRLVDPEPRVRMTAIEVIGLIGPFAADIVDPLARSLGDDQSIVRLWAAKILGDVGPAAIGAVPTLIDRLADEDDGVRVTAAETLGLIGDPSARPALAHLVESDEPEFLRQVALRALDRLDRSDAAKADGDSADR